ncbi:ATP-binding cassette domain-containing protein [Enterococcus faecium]
MGIVLDVKNVARTFSENKGILDISFQLKQREILFLYGEHDTGKTLLLQILIGAILPESGVVELFGSSDYIKEKIELDMYHKNHIILKA